MSWLHLGKLIGTSKNGISVYRQVHQLEFGGPVRTITTSVKNGEVFKQIIKDGNLGMFEAEHADSICTNSDFNDAINVLRKYVKANKGTSLWGHKTKVKNFQTGNKTEIVGACEVRNGIFSHDKMKSFASKKTDKEGNVLNEFAEVYLSERDLPWRRLAAYKDGVFEGSKSVKTMECFL